MRRIREALRLHLQAGMSCCEVGRALKISQSAVGKYVAMARVAGVDCVVAEGCCRQPAGWQARRGRDEPGHEPYAYIKDVLGRLPTHPDSRIAELLPHRWSPAS